MCILVNSLIFSLMCFFSDSLDYSVYPLLTTLLTSDVTFCVFGEDTTVAVLFLSEYSDLCFPLSLLMHGQTDNIPIEKDHASFYLAPTV